jgi:surfactin synthase thioesterase subunit
MNSRNPAIRSLGGSPLTLPRLICFPHAGGSATVFAPLAQALLPSVSVVGINYPGHLERMGDPLADNVAQLADEIAALDVFAHKETVGLLGHSMGAIIAYEVAVRLELAGRPASCLFVSSHQAPNVPHTERRSQWPDDDLWRDVVRLNGVPAELAAVAEFMALMLPILRNDYYCMETYADRMSTLALSASIVATCGSEEPDMDASDLSAWATFTRSRFKSALISGDHFYFLDNLWPLAELVAKQLGAGRPPG